VIAGNIYIPHGRGQTHDAPPPCPPCPNPKERFVWKIGPPLKQGKSTPNPIEFAMPPWGWYGYFLESHITLFITRGLRINVKV